MTELTHEVTNDLMPERPFFLTVLCVFSFIGSGFIAVLSFIGIVLVNWLAGLFKVVLPDLSSTASTPMIISALIIFILFALSFWGAIMMYNLKKGGYIMYVIPNSILLVFQSYFLLTNFSFFWLAYFLGSIAFIILYAFNIRYMNQ